MSFLLDVLFEAIFPLSEEERMILKIKIENIWQVLPRAPFSSIPEACSLFAYKDSRVANIIWSLKYKKSKHSARLGGFAMWNVLKTYSRAAVLIILIPMPISKQRRRERGFNQCELIVDEVERLQIIEGKNSLISKLYFTKKLLLRPKNIARQTLKDRKDRLEEAHDLFKVDQTILNKFLNKLNDAENYLVFVIDDVVTTGSTMREAVQILRKAGLTNTYGLALAH